MKANRLKNLFLNLVVFIPFFSFGQGYYYNPSWSVPPQMPTYQQYNPNPYGSTEYYNRERFNRLQNQGNWIRYQQDMYFYYVRKNQQDDSLRRALDASSRAGEEVRARREEFAKQEILLSNDPDQKSALNLPKNTNNTKIVILREDPSGLLNPTFDVVINGKTYGKIKDDDILILEKEAGQQNATIVSDVYPSPKVKFDANSGSTQYLFVQRGGNAWSGYSYLLKSIEKQEGESIFLNLKGEANETERSRTHSRQERSSSSIIKRR